MERNGIEKKSSQEYRNPILWLPFFYLFEEKNIPDTKTSFFYLSSSYYESDIDTKQPDFKEFNFEGK